MAAASASSSSDKLRLVIPTNFLRGTLLYDVGGEDWRILKNATESSNMLTAFICLVGHVSQTRRIPTEVSSSELTLFGSPRVNCQLGQFLAYPKWHSNRSHGIHGANFTSPTLRQTVGQAQATSSLSASGLCSSLEVKSHCPKFCRES